MSLNNELLRLNDAGPEIELTQEQANDLGAIEETAITEDEAIESTQDCED